MVIVYTFVSDIFLFSIFISLNSRYSREIGQGIDHTLNLRFSNSFIWYFYSVKFVSLTMIVF